MDLVQQQLNDSEQTQPSISKYHYFPLPSPDQIRVFTLHQGTETDPLTDELQHISLNNPPSYEALSYEWGHPDHTQKVFIINTPQTSLARLRIPQSLFHALRDLRHADRPRTVWADTLCTDQTNLPERQHQVSLMGQVYRATSRVATYIGPDDGTSSLALSLMYSFIPILSGGDASSETIPPASDPRCTAFQALVLKGWAGRCWCAQEFLLNSDLIMLSGRCEMLWFLLPSMVQLLATHKFPTYLIPPDPLFLRECLSAMFTMRGAMHLGGGYAPSLFELLVLTYPMRATDPRDKIYSLLGVAKDVEALSIVVDYTSRVEELYIDVAKKILDMDRTAMLLQWNLGVKKLELPSWVPDWTSWRPGSMEMMVGKAHRAGGTEWPDMKVVGGERRLEVAGAVVDSVSFLSERVGPLFENDVTDDDDDDDGGKGGLHPAAQFLDEMLAQASDLSPYPKDSSPVDLLSRTLTCDMALNDDPAPENHVEHFSAFRASYTNTTTTIKDTEVDSITTHEQAHTFRQNVHKRMRYRRLCVTNKKFFGAVPQEAEVGDAVCVVEGAKGLHVLRPAPKVEEGGGEMFRLVGPAYVHGLMQGEGMLDLGYKKGVVVLV